jgi:hypothetical protein
MQKVTEPVSWEKFQPTKLLPLLLYYQLNIHWNASVIPYILTSNIEFSNDLFGSFPRVFDFEQVTW